MKYKRATRFVMLIAITVLLIINHKDTSFAAAEGIDLCIKVVIPSLFPLMFLTSILAHAQIRGSIPLLNRLGLSPGVHSLFLLGLISGYPVGAELVQDAYAEKRISKSAAQRMLSFCNNPGPSFIFGILSPLFCSKIVPFSLWVIIILSSILTAYILPGKTTGHAASKNVRTASASQVLTKCIRSMGIICGWVILFRILYFYLGRYVLCNLPDTLTIILTGLGELTNGCLALRGINNEAVRFIVCSAFLSFGGVCVTMQTAAVAKDMDMRTYLRGKLLQTVIACTLALLLSIVIFS